MKKSPGASRRHHKASAVYAALAFAGLLCTGATAQEPKRPSPPPATVPNMTAGETTLVCVGCPKPFDLDGHKEALKDLAANVFVAELRKALYMQDVVHQFESKAHFDNCDFDGGAGYIADLLTEADGHVQTMSTLKSKGDKDGMVESAKKAFFALGQALHAVQDFYAHSNYVELSKESAKKTQDMQVIAPWRKEWPEQLAKLKQQRLVSGFVFWGIPQLCPSGTISHADLAKDKATTKSGAVKVVHLQNQSQHQIALFLARKASEMFLADAFKRWPLLKEVNGELVAFEVLVDRRGI